jgi:UPF0755 protein
MRFVFRLILLLVLGAALLAWDVQRQLHLPLPLTAETSLDIPKGRAFSAVIGDMDQRGLLPSARAALYLRAYVRLKNHGGRIKSGEYVLAPGVTLVQAVALFVSGRTLLYELRFVEGWTFAQAMAQLRAHPQLRHTLPDLRAETVMTALGHPGMHPEGRFFPDTYRFSRDTPDLTVLRNAFDAQARILDSEWQQRAANLPYASAEEALIMASIIEKETGLASERGEIAGVFVRRLGLGMRLQTDPTVIYGIGETFDGNIRLRDLRTDTPYNTYTRGGLPPTPICLPGRAAIHAALHPQDGRSLFFVSRGDGSHVFSETLDQHNAAVRRYQLKQP